MGGSGWRGISGLMCWFGGFLGRRWGGGGDLSVVTSAVNGVRGCGGVLSLGNGTAGMIG